MIQKFYIVLNGLEADVICKDNLKDAQLWAKNMFPDATDVIVREIEISSFLAGIGTLFINLKNRFPK